MNISNDQRIIVALDYNDQNKALAFVDQIDPALAKLKVGKEMFTYFGPQFVKQLIDRSFDVFLDLKFHDIPNTVARAVTAAADLGVWMVNVHASGGSKMLTAAKKALESYGKDAPYLIAVTILTSIDQAELKTIGIDRDLTSQVELLAQLTKNSGLDGVVCSALEAPRLRKALGDDFLLVTPGIRPLNSSVGDQSRIVTPKQAIINGSSYMVIGRPITQAENPLQALKAIIAELS